MNKKYHSCKNNKDCSYKEESLIQRICESFSSVFQENINCSNCFYMNHGRCNIYGEAIKQENTFICDKFKIKN